MEITLLPFAHTRDRFGFASRTIPCVAEETPREVVRRIVPDLDLSSLRVALDCEYVTWDTPLGGAREMAIIPPVSGG